MSDEHLAGVLAARVMRWRVTPNRFLTGRRGWIPRWRFQPAHKLEDALRLLDGAQPDEYAISGGRHIGFNVRVRIGNVIGEARGPSKPLAITHAIARAVGIEVQ